MLCGGHVEWRRRLCAGHGQVVLAGQVHLTDHLRLQLPVTQAAVPQALPLPSLRCLAVFTDPEPVGRAPVATEESQSKTSAH